MTTNGITIHRVTPDNTSVLTRVDDDVFDNPVQPALLNDFLANPSNLLVVAVADDTVVGMATGIAYVHPDKPLQLFVNEVGVSPRYQRQGIGKDLVDSLLEHGKQLGCVEAWVATEVGNTPARALYHKLGGEEDDEQAVVYTWSLAD
ncbi:MAG: GNAT family N-acetyltransferase [Gammaproteobacteria bacterium]|nr:GNAT family N-acetyltransferase [Gammaproteobacteria bacterium]